jgi:phosphoribosyl 1,2-cyclic phosphate phosphodiesterase
MLGVRYPEEFLANPRNHRTRSSLLVRGPGGNLLVDCPPELRLQMHREQLFEIDQVLITHTHADHVMGMDDLRSICILTGEAIPVMSRPEHQADIRRIFPYAFMTFAPGIHVPRFELSDVPEQATVCGMDVRFFHVNHGSVLVTGIRINDFAYITDVSSIPEEVMPLLEGLEYLVLDAVRLRPHQNHLHYDAAVEVAERIGATTTYFTHLSSDYDIFEAEMPGHLRLAYDGLRLEI